MGAGEVCHFFDEAWGAGGDDVAGVAEVGVWVIGFFTKDAVEDHGEEVVDEGSIPAVEELFFEVAEVVDEFAGAELGEGCFDF